MAGLEQDPATTLVVVIDDDASVCEALRGLFESVGLQTKTYGSVQEFVAARPAHAPSCIVLDIRLPGQSGIEFQEALERSGTAHSIVFISGHVDVEMAVRAMKGGAVDVFAKPVREQNLLDAVNRAIQLSSRRRSEVERAASLYDKYAQLTQREREVMALVTEGLLNKQIAGQVGLSEATVKLHRAQVMRKMDAASVPDLVRMADLLGQVSARARPPAP